MNAIMESEIPTAFEIMLKICAQFVASKLKYVYENKYLFSKRFKWNICCIYLQ